MLCLAQVKSRDAKENLSHSKEEDVDARCGAAAVPETEAFPVGERAGTD